MLSRFLYAFLFALFVRHAVFGPQEAWRALLQQHRTLTQHKLSTGHVVNPPYVAHEARGVVVAAFADATAARAMVPAGYEPVLNAQGDAVTTLWFMDYNVTTCGAYKELVLVIHVAEKGTGLTVADPMGVYHVALLEPRARAYGHYLWLDSDVAIAYGRELFALDKHKAVVTSSWTDASIAFDVKGVASLRVKTPTLASQSFAALARGFGLGGLWTLFTQSTLSPALLGKAGVSARYPAHAPTMVDTFLVAPFAGTSLYQDADGIRLDVQHDVLRRLKLTPVLANVNNDAKFVIPNPVD